MNLKTVLNDEYGSAKSEKPDKVKKLCMGVGGGGNDFTFNKISNAH